MFIAVVGTRRSGRKTIVECLQSKGFVLLSVALGAGVRSTMSSQPESSINNDRLSLEFTSLSEMLVFATRNWRDNFVTLDITNIQDFEPFAKRPFFMLISVDAPVLTRFRRGNHSSLENFLEEHDKLLYSVNAPDPEPADSCMTKKSSLHELSRFAKLSIINDFETVQSLYHHLDFLNILDSDRLRPSWDSYFMTLASLASMRSNCMKRRVGAIIVREKRIVATGYNGTPRGLANCNEGGCAKCNGSATRNETCLCLHAEENALLEACRERIAGATLYCNTCPCLTCTIKIVQVGVSEVVYNLSYKMDDASARLFQDAGVVLRRYAPPP